MFETVQDRTEAILMTLSHLQGHSLLQTFSNVIFVQLWSCTGQYFNWQSTSRGSSATVELLV